MRAIICLDACLQIRMMLDRVPNNLGDGKLVLCYLFSHGGQFFLFKYCIVFIVSCNCQVHNSSIFWWKAFSLIIPRVIPVFSVVTSGVALPEEMVYDLCWILRRDIYIWTWDISCAQFLNFTTVPPNRQMVSIMWTSIQWLTMCRLFNVITWLELWDKDQRLQPTWSVIGCTPQLQADMVPLVLVTWGKDWIVGNHH